MSCRVGLYLRFGLCILYSPGAIAAAEPLSNSVPLKNAPSHKGFDFRRPAVGEIRPNPSSGTGPPPSLKEYAPANPSAPFNAGAVSSVPHQHTSEQASHPAGPTTASSSATASTDKLNTASDAIALQASFAAQIARRGIHAALSFIPDHVPTTDRADLQRWQNWKQTLDATQVPRPATEAVDVRVEVAPGALTLLQAPARITGASDVPQRP